MPVNEFFTDGVDYSSTGNADWHGLFQTLKANGKKFIGRYAVNDKSPGGRGIGGTEFQAARDEGMGVFLYWESTAGWINQGWQVGVYAAQNAQWNIDTAGIPHNAIVYFAADEDFGPGDYAAIDDTLRGAASVIGPERVGIYGGIDVVRHCLQSGSARWGCQTSAWSRGEVLPEAVLYQHDYNKFYYGTNCDLVQASEHNYGQVDYEPFVPAVDPDPPAPVTPPAPQYPKPRPCPYDVLHGKDWVDSKGNKWWAIRRTVFVKPGTTFHVRGSDSAPESRPPAGPDGMHVTIAGKVNGWYVTPIGSTFRVASADVDVRFKA